MAIKSRASSSSSRIADSNDSMELLLNTIWLLLAIATFLLWVPRKARSAPADRDPSSFVAVLALACALVLLFPAISLTDDLHAEQATMEDSSRTVMKARGLAQECLRAGRAAFMLAPVITPCAYTGRFVIFGSVVLLKTHVFRLNVISPHAGRAPPFNA